MYKICIKCNNHLLRKFSYIKKWKNGKKFSM